MRPCLVPSVDEKIFESAALFMRSFAHLIGKFRESCCTDEWVLAFVHKKCVHFAPKTTAVVGASSFFAEVPCRKSAPPMFFESGLKQEAFFPLL